MELELGTIDEWERPVRMKGKAAKLWYLITDGYWL